MKQTLAPLPEITRPGHEPDAQVEMVTIGVVTACSVSSSAGESSRSAQAANANDETTRDETRSFMGTSRQVEAGRSGCDRDPAAARVPAVVCRQLPGRWLPSPRDWLSALAMGNPGAPAVRDAVRR